MKALIIDDEPQIRRALRAILEPKGFTVLPAATGEEGLDQAAVHSPDIVLLDLGLPDISGMEVCRRLREWSSAPIIVVSVHEEPEEKVAALELGADDYVTKPFHVAELLARMQAVLRRGESGQAHEPSFAAGDLYVDFALRRVQRAGRDVRLTPIEYELLRCLVQHAGRILTHQQLLARVWGARYVGDLHTLRVHVANLRNKIEADSTNPHFIQTEPRIGYRFCGEPEPVAGGIAG